MSLLTFKIDSDRSEPIYMQLYNFVKEEIKKGNLQKGEKLPSERKLSMHLKISRNTIETAYSQLCAEGYITSVPKSGYFVSLEDMSKIEVKPFKYNEIQAEARENSQFIFDFDINTVDTTHFPIATWTKISREIMHDKNRELLKMTHPQGDYNLRQNIAKYLHSYRGVNCRPEQIVIGAGTEYLLGLIIQILGRKSVYAVENPGYTKTYEILRCNDVNVRLIGLDREGISISGLTDTDCNIAYVTPSNHFPLSILMPVNRRMQLLRWAYQQDDRYIIEDDYDSEYRFNSRPIPALQGMDSNGRVIYINTFSKSIAPSIRISYMVLPPLLLDRYKNNFMIYSSTVSRFEQYTLYKFINNGHFERHLNRMHIIYKSKKEKLTDEIRKSPLGKHVEITGEDAGLHLLLKINANLCEEELISRAAKAGIKVYGLSNYYIIPDKDMHRSTVILGYTNLEISRIEEAVKLLNMAWLNL